MGYDHYLWRPPELDLERWRDWVGDVREIIANLPASVPKTYHPLDGPPVTVRAPLIVGGPVGNEGRPQLNDHRVAFNGAGWADVEGRPQRLWGASFWIERHFDRVLDSPLLGDPYEPFGPDPDERGWWCDSFRTNQRPYDLAVTASLIRLAHRFPEGVQVSSDGGPEEWQAGLDLCRDVFGHAELPFAGHGGPAPAAGPDRLSDLLAKRDSGLLAPHEVGELRELLDRDLEPDAAPDSIAEPGWHVNEPECAP